MRGFFSHVLVCQGYSATNMPQKIRIPITSITVLGTSILLAVTVGIALYLGFSQAAKSTQQLWAKDSSALIEAMEQNLESQFNPVREQALWVAKDIDDLSSLSAHDDYMNGVLAGTPQVVGIALVTKNGQSRRWGRSRGEAIDEDWSSRPEIMSWLEQLEHETAPAWRDPIWERSVSTTTLLHDIPIRNPAGEFIGVFAQVVPLNDLSSQFSGLYTDTGLTPFILYDKQYVLAHPILISSAILPESQQQPLHSLESLGDIILTRIWTPDDSADFFSGALTDIEANGVFWGEKFYIYLYRDIHRYGNKPWTIGAYINTSLIEDDNLGNLAKALLVGIGILILAIVASSYGGHRVSLPVKAIAKAAETVETGNLEAVTWLPRSRIRELDDANTAFNNMIKGLNERELIRKTLGRFVPAEIAGSLLADGGNIKPVQTEATILFCDIESFTQLTESLGPVKIAEVLNAYFSSMVDILEQHHGVVTQFQGDAILATFNVPVSDPKHATNAIHAACDMLDRVAESNFGGQTLKIRIGINSGSVFAGAIGAEGRLNYTVHGDAVNLAARLEALNKERGTRLIVSENSQLLANEFEFENLGDVVVRGQTQSIKCFTLPRYNT